MENNPQRELSEMSSVFFRTSSLKDAKYLKMKGKLFLTILAIVISENRSAIRKY
jgi:hypothetical protein